MIYFWRWWYDFGFGAGACRRIVDFVFPVHGRKSNMYCGPERMFRPFAEILKIYFMVYAYCIRPSWRRD